MSCLCALVSGAQPFSPFYIVRGRVAGFPRLCVLCLWWWEWLKLGALQCVVCTVADLLKLLP